MKKSLRGKLIEEVATDFCIKNTFIFFDQLEEELQKTLNKHLSFETKISDLKQDGKFMHGKISFKDENTANRSIDFTIISNTIMERFSDIDKQKNK